MKKNKSPIGDNDDDDGDDGDSLTVKKMQTFRTSFEMFLFKIKRLMTRKKQEDHQQVK